MLLKAWGDLLMGRLLQAPDPCCLMCADDGLEDCHRQQIAKCLVQQGHTAAHIE